MTKEEAKELSIAKWEYIVDHSGSDGEESEVNTLILSIPILGKILNGCGFCEMYLNFNSIYECKGCPLSLENINGEINKSESVDCMVYKHPYNHWVNNPTKENAQIILDIIKNSKI